MKMRFWQKTYLFTLALFLLCLNIGVLSLTMYTYQKNVQAAEGTAKAEQAYIAATFERDHNDIMEADGSPVLLMQSFGAHYGKKGLYLAFEEDGQVLYSNFGRDHSVAADSMVHTEFDGERYLLISSEVCGYQLIMGKNVSQLDSEFRSMMVTYGLTALGVSAFLAVCLYFVLKKLSEPLEKLRKTTQMIEAGDYTVRAEERGNDEFTLLARSFNAMLEKINEQMETLELDAKHKQMLVDDLAHELRTPLTSIYGYGEFLEKAAATEEQRIIAAKYIMSQARRLQKISEILLDDAFIRGNEPEMGVVDAGAVLADVAEKLQMKAQDAGVALVCEETAMEVRGNETLLSMLVFNLAENAIKACAPGGRVELSCGAGVICVADDGKGMTQEQLLHITEPFYRTDKARARAEGGAGLGLALSKRIVDSHGARLQFESEVDKGTRVFVEFGNRT